MNGKSKCKILKEIRKQIAAENDITYVTSECPFKGDCTGTCPKCEAEVRYLEEQLRLRQKAGKAVAVAGIAATLMVAATGCNQPNEPQPTTSADPLPSSGYETQVLGEIITHPADEDFVFKIDEDAQSPEEPVIVGGLTKIEKSWLDEPGQDWLIVPGQNLLAEPMLDWLVDALLERADEAAEIPGQE